MDKGLGCVVRGAVKRNCIETKWTSCKGNMLCGCEDSLREEKDSLAGDVRMGNLERNEELNPSNK
jgi:hypothetical protein